MFFISHARVHMRRGSRFSVLGSYFQRNFGSWEDERSLHSSTSIGVSKRVTECKEYYPASFCCFYSFPAVFLAISAMVVPNTPHTCPRTPANGPRIDLKALAMAKARHGALKAS